MRFFLVSKCLSAAALLVLAPAAPAQPVQLPDGRRLAEVDFDRHVQPLLDRQGCNAGKCHGNLEDPGGKFRLSLFGVSPEQDHEALTRADGGRRVNRLQADQSLLLLKATAALDHGGGRRLRPQSWEYQVLRRWIADGATRRPGSGAPPQLEAQPTEILLAGPGHVAAFKIFARHADGSREDVTCFCDFRHGKDAPARVDAAGRVEGLKPGSMLVHAFYRGRPQTVAVFVKAPGQGQAWEALAEVNLIDRHVAARLRQHGLPPSPPAADTDFFRRVHIDIIATLPTPDEVRAFLADMDPHKRTKVIERLLAHPRRHSVWAWRLCDQLDLRGSALGVPQAEQTAWAQLGFDWLRERVTQNTPYDQLARAVLLATTANGLSADDVLRERTLLDRDVFQGKTDRYRRRQTLDVFWMRKPDRDGTTVRVFAEHGLTRARPSYAELMADHVAGAFLGVRLECARCHIHPLDVWTPADHRAFAAFFDSTEYAAAGVRSVPAGQGAALPRALGERDAVAPGDRAALAQWVTARDNPFFARAFVNRVWSWYFGRGLADAGSTQTLVNPPSHPELLDELARDFVAHGYDLRRLERLILFSATYQRSSTPTDHNKHNTTLYAQFPVTRPPPRLQLDLILDALDVPLPSRHPLALGRRAVEFRGEDGHELLFNDNLHSPPEIEILADRFGRGDLVARCNGDGWLPYLATYSNPLDGLLRDSKRLRALVQSKATVEDRLTELMLAALSRLPTEKEVQAVKEYLSRRQGRPEPELVIELGYALIAAVESNKKR
jgi:hypothetical protein